MATDLDLELESNRRAGTTARGAVRSQFKSHIPAQRLYDLELVVTELVNNSVLYGPGKPIQLRVGVDDRGLVRGEIEDAGDGEIAIRDMEEGMVGGWGLRFVDSIVDEWGVHAGSTHVWFEMRPG